MDKLVGVRWVVRCARPRLASCRSFSTNRTREFWLASYFISLPGKGKKTTPCPVSGGLKQDEPCGFLWQLVLLSRQSPIVTGSSIYLPLERERVSQPKKTCYPWMGPRQSRLPSRSLGPRASRKATPLKQQQSDLRPIHVF